ncbi:hypothetical protein Pla163_15370 [Planctomycetes bacterium Pla163]|uniref:Uncharacterized protein n=1 Tax=Rohdeia mirabilis TaxID=2528008 RepID=A0A518CYX5_9BACT|nr:hypothetical protein Pla163_15370 [Planctomycetes bacterium Pla163]
MARLLLLVLALLPLGCRSSSSLPADEIDSISFVGELRGYSFDGGDRLTMRNDYGVERVDVLSQAGDPGVKLAPPFAMNATYERLLELGMEGRLRPGALPTKPGFEIERQGGLFHFSLAQARTEGVTGYTQMVLDFADIYSNVLSLQAVDQERALEALRASEKTALGR